MAKRGFKFDVPLCIVVLALVGAGMVLIYSSSAPYAAARGLSESFYLAQHVKRVLIGLIVFLGAMVVPYRVWERIAAPLIVFALATLFFIFVSGATRVNGAQRWITFASFGLQPSELAKLAVIFYLARTLARKERTGDLSGFVSGILVTLALPFLAVVLIVLQPNFSTALTVLGLMVVLLFAGGVRKAHLLMLGGGALPVVLGVMLAQPYRVKRVLAFLDPLANPASAYQSQQALISLGNGGLIGTGLGEGTQKLGYLPMPFTDTVFAILGEELGFIGTMGILALFGLVAWRGLRVARDCPDRFGSLAATGLSVSLAISVVIHVGVCVSLFPTTGQPLPFVSYGGTSLIAHLMGMGILLNISNAAAVPAEPAPPLVWRSARRDTPLRPYGRKGRDTSLPLSPGRNRA